MHKIVNGEVVELTKEEQEATILEWEANANRRKRGKWKYRRIEEYGSVEDQLDLIFHEGLDAWRDKIHKIKLKYPKP